ncbi:hypothetical protein NEOLI_000189 [Neolecta irregularis DAH-3]|uniref:Peroxisome assembly protein 22 n=1 Tax=Neolecta irregularis (strain DAH-3) TaxID=1198029 RepID=A0A1U7LTL8_NEOID|nr:hypothetical protein NEOLI_000189 [Neolecta irregularis DAH-3]|eukprot:OLL26016.1 hypothetical protein NEOLI_000189 [Neolecta irregularis DAH-3]
MAPRKMSYIQVLAVAVVTTGIGYLAYSYCAPLVAAPVKPRKVAVIMDKSISIPSNAKERSDLVVLVNVEEHPDINLAEQETKVHDASCILKCRKRDGIVHMLRMLGVDVIVLSEEYQDLIPQLREWAPRVIVFTKTKDEWNGKVRYLNEQRWDATIFGTPGK